MKLKQFSLQNISISIQAVIKRFPLAMFAALSGTIATLVLIHSEDLDFIPNFLLTLSFAGPLFVGIVLITHAKKWSDQYMWCARFFAVLFLFVYYFLLPDLSLDAFGGESIVYIRHFMWSFGFVLLITFIPFVTKKGREITTAFWEYNRVLVFSFVLTMIWLFALQIGLSIAMGSIDFLFDVNIDPDRYAELWAILYGLFAPLFFLHRIPKDPQIFDKKLGYPKEVRLFSQFVLVPLVTIYFLILYAYVIRILVTSVWPEGQLAYMILGFSFLGVLTYISLYPLRSSVYWVEKAGAILFAAMIPQVGMLFWALWFRVSAYGITENRYFVFLFGCWLFGMSVYYLFSKQKDLRLIPITLFCIAFLSSFGPWGAFQVSERSQINRIEEILVRNEMLINSVLNQTDRTISQDDVIQIGAIVRYIDEFHGLEGLYSWFEIDAQTLEGRTIEEYLVDMEVYKIVEEEIGVEYFDQIEMEEVLHFADEGDGYFYRDFSDFDSVYLLNGQYDYLLHVNAYSWDDESANESRFNESSYMIRIIDDRSGLELLHNGEVLVVYSLQEFMSHIRESPQTNEGGFIEFQNNRINGVLYVNSINGETEDGFHHIDSLQGVLLFSLVE